MKKYIQICIYKSFGLFLIVSFIYYKNKYYIVELLGVFIMKKITKKEYFKMMDCEHYYVTPFIGTFEELNDYLSTEKSAEIIKNECQKFTGIYNYDYKTYIHIISNSEWKEENKKGKFYIEMIDDVLYVYHKESFMIHIYAIL